MWTSLQAGLKRALHAHLGGKESFQLIRFGLKGEPRLWAQDLMAPSETALQAAEEWIDQLRPAERSNLVEAVRFAMAFKRRGGLRSALQVAQTKQSELNRFKAFKVKLYYS